MGDTSGRNLKDVHLYVCNIEILSATLEKKAGLETTWGLFNAQPFHLPTKYHDQRGGQLGVAVVRTLCSLAGTE